MQISHHEGHEEHKEVQPRITRISRILLWRRCLRRQCVLVLRFSASQLAQTFQLDHSSLGAMLQSQNSSFNIACSALSTHPLSLWDMRQSRHSFFNVACSRFSASSTAPFGAMLQSQNFHCCLLKPCNSTTTLPGAMRQSLKSSLLQNSSTSLTGLHQILHEEIYFIRGLRGLTRILL